MEALKNNENRIILSKNTYFIIDNKKEERTDFVNKENKWELKIEISTEEENIFLDNERHIMNLVNTKKCDWLLFNNSDIFFIEAKDVNTRGRKQAKKIAKMKFKDTLDFYNANFTIPKNIVLNAILNFRNSNIPTRAASKDNKAYYKEILGLNYEEKNVLIIS